MNERFAITELRDRDDQGAFFRPPELSEFVPVIFVEGLSRSRRIKNVLERLGIPTIVQCSQGGAGQFAMPPKRIPVLVPEDMHYDATEIVARMEQEIIAGFDDDDDDGDDDDLDDDFFDDDGMDDDDDYGDDDEELYDDDDDDLESDD